MEKIKKYQQAIVSLLEANLSVTDTESEHIREEIIIDPVKHHYFLMWLGFNQNNGFVNRIIMHFQIKTDHKIWILANWTEEDVAEALIERGVEKLDIVLGFYPPYVRPHTGYAVA